MKPGPAPAEVDGFRIIDRRYLHVTPTPCFAGKDGPIWLERSWRHDLVEHLSYLKRFVNCAPLEPPPTGEDLVPFAAPEGARIELLHLPRQTGFLRALANLPRTAFRLWRAIGSADIVQSGVGGWPYPLGWITNPMALLRGKRLVLVVESDWRLTRPGRGSFLHRIANMDPLRDRMARWSCRRAHLALFTHEDYRRALCSESSERAYVTPAVWVNEQDVLGDGEASVLWDAKAREPVRCLFAGRIVASKGVEVLLAALDSLESRGVEVRVDVIGKGDLREACLRAGQRFRRVRLSVLEPVPYGPRFFELVRRYHALLVPSLSDEQPRVVFDANSQAVPVIASATKGLRPHVDPGTTGWLVGVGDATDLAAAIERATARSSELRGMGMSALGAGRGSTHKEMHRWRSQLIAKHCL